LTNFLDYVNILIRNYETQIKEVIFVADYTKMWELKRKMKEEGITYAELADEIGMGVNTLSDKLNGKSSFNIDEVQRIMKVLKIKNSEVPHYFFN
jgi:predicted transcriptional regulator